jgi:hypothetical protein
MTDAALNQRAVERALARLLVDTSSRHTGVVRLGGTPLFWQSTDPNEADLVALGQQVAQTFAESMNLAQQLEPQRPHTMLFKQGVSENILMAYAHRTWVLYCVFAKGLAPGAIKARVREAARELEALLPR